MARLLRKMHSERASLPGRNPSCVSSQNFVLYVTTATVGPRTCCGPTSKCVGGIFAPVPGSAKLGIFTEIFFSLRQTTVYSLRVDQTGS